MIKCPVLRDSSNTVRTEGLPGSTIEANADPRYPSSDNGRYGCLIHESTIEPPSNTELELQWLDEDSNTVNSGTDSQSLGHVPRGLASLDHFSPLQGSPFWLDVIPDRFDSPNLDQYDDLFQLQQREMHLANLRPRFDWLKPLPSNELIYRMLKGILYDTRKRPT
jgi:hypothetical protein